MMSYPVWIVSVWIAIAACVCMLNGTEAVTNADTFLIVGCKNNIFVGLEDDFQFQSVLTPENRAINVDYDYKNQHIYYTNSLGNLYRCDLDGGNPIMVYNVSFVNDFTVDAESGYLFLLVGSARYRATIPNNFTFVYEGGLSNIVDGSYQAKDSRVYFARFGSIQVRDIVGNVCTGEEYVYGSEYGKLFEVDEAARTIYHAANAATSGPSYLLAKDMDTDADNLLLNTTLKYEPYAIAVSGDWIYSIYGEAPNYYPLARFPKAGGNDGDIEFLGTDALDGKQSCSDMHIHQGIPPSVAASTTVIPKKEFKGGLILDVVLDTSGADWARIDIIFPRPVFQLKITGCDALVEKKRATNKGNTYTIVPSSASGARPGKDGRVRLTVLGKTWGNRRGFKQDIIAEIYTISKASLNVPLCGK